MCFIASVTDSLDSLVADIHCIEFSDYKKIESPAEKNVHFTRWLLHMPKI